MVEKWAMHQFTESDHCLFIWKLHIYRAGTAD